jgi:hypothetical protein
VMTIPADFQGPSKKMDAHCALQGCFGYQPLRQWKRK